MLQVTQHLTNDHFDLLLKSPAGRWNQLFRWSPASNRYQAAPSSPRSKIKRSRPFSSPLRTTPACSALNFGSSAPPALRKPLLVSAPILQTPPTPTPSAPLLPPPDRNQRLPTRPVFVHEDSQREPIFVGSQFVIVPVAHEPDLSASLTPVRIVLPIEPPPWLSAADATNPPKLFSCSSSTCQTRPFVFGIRWFRRTCPGGANARRSPRHRHGYRRTRYRRHPRPFLGPLFVGSADCLAPESADIVICNITGPLIDRLAYHLNYILKPDGRLILSGFTVETAPRRFQPNNSRAR